jgi:hypothetical protein
MPPDTPNPASAAARTGSGNDVCFGGEQFPDRAPAQKYQARILARRFRLRRDRARLIATLAFQHGRRMNCEPPRQAEILRNPRAVAANNPAAGRRVRLQYLARRLHGLGEKPLFHFIDEVERGADLRQHLERYAALPAAFIKANDGDRFAPIVHVVDGREP